MSPCSSSSVFLWNYTILPETFKWWRWRELNSCPHYLSTHSVTCFLVIYFSLCSLGVNLHLWGLGYSVAFNVCRIPYRWRVHFPIAGSTTTCCTQFVSHSLSLINYFCCLLLGSKSNFFAEVSRNYVVSVYFVVRFKEVIRLCMPWMSSLNTSIPGTPIIFNF